MKVCYVDESGCTGMMISPTCEIQPVLVICGVIVKEEFLADITRNFLELKRKYFPKAVLSSGQSPSYPLDWVLAEIKGSSLRQKIRATGRKGVRHTIGFLDKMIAMLEWFDVVITGRVWIKGIGEQIDGRAIYTSSFHAICDSFHHCLSTHDRRGIIIADSRTKPQNANVAYSIFTTKFKVGGDNHKRIVEMPTFGHSENHVGLQLADLISSALIFPMACYAYCTGHVRNVHVHDAYKSLQDRYGERIKNLQYRFLREGKWKGGLTVSDSLTRRHGGHLFGKVAAPSNSTIISHLTPTRP